ncbi:hypothetical protein SteCoe_32217 [Stentor coeruleus]|uniref:DUF4378 domain-containing protein n=1 Tax=Stentor coeruleus TaxID=5963 RepID=A0A1R2AZJ3_9CILI|nr:hypothetical protein SteCoe_32217 [Stentor coeruleus]
MKIFKKPTTVLQSSENAETSKKKRVVKLKKTSLLDPKLLYKGTIEKKNHSSEKNNYKFDVNTTSNHSNHRSREVNISDIGPEFLSRPRSAINKTFLTKKDITRHRKAYKRHSDPSVIDEMIRKSLKKAKKSKVSSEKRQKISHLFNEFKKNDNECHSKQIKLQNLIKNQKRKSKTRKRSSPNLDYSNINTAITENSYKPKGKENLSIDFSKTNKRSCSSESKAREMQYLTNNKKSKKTTIKEKEAEKNQKTAKKPLKVRKINNLKSKNINAKGKIFNKSFCYNFHGSEKDLDQENQDINRNISFISEDSSEKLSEKENECVETTIFKDFSEIENKVTETREEMIKKYAKDKNWEEIFVQTPRQLDLSSKMKISYEGHINCEAQKPKPQLQCEKIFGLNISALKIPKKFEICKKNTSIELKAKPKPKLVFESFSKTINPDQNHKPKLLSISALQNHGILPTKPKINTKVLLEEQLSWNLALNFLIEQLQVYEITNVSQCSVDIQDPLMYSIQKKYSSLLKYINEIFDKSSAEILGSSSTEEHSKFIQITQRKKIALHRILIESSEDNNIGNFMLKKIPLECTVSSESDEEEDSKSGISHSISLMHLHENIPNKQKTIGENFDSKEIALSFGFESTNLLETEEFNADEYEDKSQDKPSLRLSLQKITSTKEYISPFMDFNKIQTFIEHVFANINTEKLLNDLKKPLVKNPLEELDRIQELQIGTPTNIEIYEFPELFKYSSFIPEAYSSSSIAQAEKTHCKMLLHTLNALLQQFRPFGSKGLPLPWINYSKIPKKSLVLSEVIDKVIEDMEDMNEMEIGNFPDISFSNTEANEMLIIKIKEKQLEKALFYETFYEDYKWIDYEFEETQVKIDLADMILHELAEEIININM